MSLLMRILLWHITMGFKSSSTVWENPRSAPGEVKIFSPQVKSNHKILCDFNQPGRRSKDVFTHVIHNLTGYHCTCSSELT